MARAAFAIHARAADLLIDLHGRVYGSHVLLLVGPGANGGDALFAGAHLANRGARVEALLTHDRAHSAGLAAFKSAGGRIITQTPTGCDLIVDGIFGMGSRGSLAELRPLPPAFMLAIDLPSGVNPDSGEVDGIHIRADLTLATGAYKVAHFVDPARDACGVIELIDLDLDCDGEDSQYESWQAEDVARLLDAHRVDPTMVDKYRRGVLGICAGSDQYPGAGLLCADSALAVGIGMIRSYSEVDLRQERPEVVMVDGQIQALAVGPGLTNFDKAQELLARDVPAVVDAGAVSVVTPGRPVTVITPHAGELARLLNVDRSWIEAHRDQALAEAVERLKVVILLKGSTSLIAAPDGRRAANPTGSAALATAGSGDVLTGLIGALLARGIEPFSAAVAASWIHGVAGAYAGSSGAARISQMVPAVIETVGVRQY